MLKKLNLKSKIFLLFSTILLFQISCAKRLNKFYNYNPYKGIKIEINIKKLKAIPEHKSVFLYFSLTIENNSTKIAYFNSGEIKAKLNNHINEYTCYDSLSSTIAETEELKQGKNTYNLYFVFPEEVVINEIKQFDIKDFGIYIKE